MPDLVPVHQKPVHEAPDDAHALCLLHLLLLRFEFPLPAFRDAVLQGHGGLDIEMIV